MATSNTMNFGPEWMRRFPKTQTSDNNRSTSPTLSSNVPTNSSSILGSTNNNTNTSVNTGTNTHSWSFVAAANSSNTTTNRSLHHEASEKSDVPGAGDSELNPFKYSKEKMLKLYKPVGLPLEFERHEYVTSEEPLQPMALINLSEHEHKLLTGTSVNSDLTRRMVSNATGGGTVTVNERVSERERVPFSPRGEKHVGTGLTSPRTERFTGITGVLSGRTSPRSSRPPRISGSANSLSADDPVWNGVTRHAVGTFDSNGVFRIPGSNNTDDESIDKSKKDDFEHNNKTEQEFEKKNPADHSDEETYYNLQEKLVNQKIEYQNENINEIDINSKSTYMEGSHSSLREEQNTIEQDGQQGWQDLQELDNRQEENLKQRNVQEDFDQQELNEQLEQLPQKQQQNNRNSTLKHEEKEREQDCDDEPDKVKNLDQQLLEQHELLQQLELHEKEMEEEVQQNEKQRQRQLQFPQREQQMQIQQRQEQEQKHLQQQIQLQLRHQQQQQHQQQQLLIQQQQQQQILQDQQDLIQHRQQQILQQQQQQHQHHQQLLLPHHFDADQDDDVLKEAFSYTNVVGNTPPMSPTKSTKYSSTHSIIGTSNAFGDTSSGASSLFSGSVITSDTRKQAPEQQKWLYRDPSGNIQGPFSSQEMNDWYKGGFFVLSLLVKRVEDPTFEPLGALIRKTGDDERPFSASITRPSLTIAMPNNSSRVINDPFPRTWATPNSPSTAQLFLDHQQRFNPFGGTASVPTTPFDRYQFGGVFGRNDVTSGWNDLGTANNTWGQTEGYSSNAGNLSPRLQAPNSPPPLFNNTASFNVSPPPTYLEQQRALTSQIERQQFLMLQQRQQLSQSAYPDGFIRQQHQSHQNFVGISGPVSAPITNAPNSPFIDSLTRSTGWPTTTEQQQQPPSMSPWGIIAPGIGATPSRVSQSDDLGYFNLRKEINLGMQQSAIIEPLQNQNRTNERQYDITGGQISEPSFDNKILSGVTESITKPILGDDEVFSKKIEENLINQEKVESKLKSEESAPQLTQNEGTLRSKPSLREIQAEEERKKQYEEKEKEKEKSINSSSSVAKLSQTQKVSNSAWGNNTFTIPAPWGKDEDHSSQKTLSIREIQELETKQSTERHIPERHISERKFSTSSTINATPAPWAKDEDHTVLKAPSIREIQEMEAKQAAERQASEKKVTTTNATTTVTKEDTVPSSISWGIVVPTSSNESNSSSLSTSPVVTAPAWQSNNPPPKKTLREIQKEEEEATKRRNKFREIQQAAINNANVPNVTTTQSNMGKRYADTVLVGNVNVGPKNLQKPPTNTMNNAWTTVASKSSRAVTTNISTTNVGTVGSGVIKPGGVSKDSPNVWDNDHKSINGLQNSSRSQNQSNKVSEAQKSSARGVNTGISKPVTTNSTVKSNNNSASGNSSEYSAPKPPSEEFLKWCRHALRGLNNVNVDEFLQMLLSFPLDPPPATIEIIQDSIYANSPTLDGRRFADEFIKRRKADANGLPMSFSHADNKLNKDLTTGNNSKEDYTGNGAGAFKVVTAKKNKKKQIN